MKSTKLILFLATLGSGLTPALSPASTIYKDSFSRTGSLNGTSPDVVNSNSSTWTAAAEFTTDGSTTNSSAGPRNAFLPFTPTSGDSQIYTLSADITPTSAGNGDWLALGFTVAASTGTAAAGVNFFDAPNSPPAWLLYRGNGGTQSFFGGGTSNGAGGPNETANSTVTFSLTLNDNTGVVTYSDAAGVFRSATLTSTQVNSIRDIGIGRYNTEAGTFDNVQLTSTPEPASAGLLAAGALALLARRRRS